jgi:hypothetical protein
MSLSTTTATPRYNLLDAMGDFTQPEILALVAKCSRTARARLTPLLNVKKSDKAEMHQLVKRLFPDIKDLEDPAAMPNSSMYTWILDAYFSPDQHYFKFEDLMKDIVPEMRSAAGRRMLLRAVDEWLQATDRSSKYDADRRKKDEKLALLERVKESVLKDFTVRFYRISTVHQEEVGSSALTRTG